MKFKIFCLLLTFAAFLSFNLPAQSPPAQATAAGFNSLVFDDEFNTTTTISPNASTTSGYKWYWYSNNVAGTYSVNTTATSGGADPGVGVLTISSDTSGYGQDLQTVPWNWTPQTRTGTFQHAYFESYIQFSNSGHTSGAWPAFWSWATQASPIAIPGQHSAELDFMEAWPYGASGTVFSTTIHDWTNTAATNATNNVQSSPNGPLTQVTDSGWHKYGCLWTQNKVQFYLDDKLCTYSGGISSFAVGPGTSFASLEQDNMFLILGTGANWPMKVDWVRVWQAGSTATQTVSQQTLSNFPSSQTLALNASPYTLPATTSAGLTVSYSVASGPASVSGDTLTFTGAGTVVVHATQAGNAGYAAFSATQTITVTPQAQTLSGFPATQTFSESSFPYTLLVATFPAVTSAGLTINYTVLSGPATVSLRTLTLTGAGTVVLQASQAGNASYASISATDTITVTPTSQTISGFPTTQTISENSFPYTLSVATFPAVTSAGLTISYTVLSGPATVSLRTLTLNGTGTVVLKASQAGNSNYQAIAATDTITVTTLPTQTISNFPATTNLSLSSPTYTLAATTSAGLAITYSVISGPATISGDTLTLTGVGTVVVQATQAGNSSYAPLTTTSAVTVTAPSGAVPFNQWEARYFTSAQMANTAISGPTAMPQNDGVSNLLKYFYDINPAQPMSAADCAAMAVWGLDTTTTPGTTYLTLTARMNLGEEGITIDIQVSPDMQNWTTVKPDITQRVGTDSNTGDGIWEVEVNTHGAPTQFIRLYVTQP